MSVKRMRPPYEIPLPVAEEVDSATAKLRVGFPRWLRMILAKDVIGITIGRRIYLSDAAMQWPEEKLQRIVRHELVHVRQMLQHGLVRFGWIYVRDYIRARRAGASKFDAYEMIPFEKEAREAEKGAVKSEG